MSSEDGKISLEDTQVAVMYIHEFQKYMYWTDTDEDDFQFYIQLFIHQKY